MIKPNKRWVERLVRITRMYDRILIRTRVGGGWLPPLSGNCRSVCKSVEIGSESASFSCELKPRRRHLRYHSSPVASHDRFGFLVWVRSGAACIVYRVVREEPWAPAYGVGGLGPRGKSHWPYWDREWECGVAYFMNHELSEKASESLQRDSKSNLLSVVPSYHPWHHPVRRLPMPFGRIWNILLCKLLLVLSTGLKYKQKKGDFIIPLNKGHKIKGGELTRSA